MLGNIKNQFGAIAPKVSFGDIGAGGGWTLGFLMSIVGVILVVLIIFVVVRYRSEKPSLLQGPIDIYDPSNNVLVSRKETVAKMKGSYTLSFYARIDAVPDMRMGAVPLLTWPGVWSLNYVPAEEKLKWIFSQSPDEDPNEGTDVVMVPQATLQRWNQYTVGFEGRSVDFYVNGALVTSTLLQNVPPSSVSSISIVPSHIMGQIAYVQMWPRRLTTSEVALNYTDTSDSQGRPYLGPNVFAALQNVKVPNLFCPGGDCSKKPTASPSQTWEFPYQ